MSLSEANGKKREADTTERVSVNRRMGMTGILTMPCCEEYLANRDGETFSAICQLFLVSIQYFELVCQLLVQQ